MTGPTLRLLRPEDADALALLAKAEGRNVLAADYARFLALEGARGLVVEVEGRFLCAATGIRYFDRAFLGPVLGPEGGLDVFLLSQLVAALQAEGVPLLECEATPREEAVLVPMGFTKVEASHVLERPASAALDRVTAVPMETTHALDVGALDAQAVGHGRKEFLLALQAAYPGGARVVEEGGELHGFVFLRKGLRSVHLGPLVTRPGADGAGGALLDDAIRAAGSWPIVAVASAGGKAESALKARGFLVVGALARLRAGQAASPTAEEWLRGSRLTG